MIAGTPRLYMCSSEFYPMYRTSCNSIRTKYRDTRTEAEEGRKKIKIGQNEQ